MPHPTHHDAMHPCARGPHCAARTIDPDTGHTTPAWTWRPLCDADRDLVQHALVQLPRMHDHIAAGDGLASAGDGIKVATSREAPVLIDLGADELVRLIQETLVSWEERVRAVARLSPLDTATSRARRGHVVVAQASRILAPRVDALLVLPAEPMMRDGELAELDGLDAAFEIFQLIWRCRATLTDTTAPARPLSTPCRCGLRRLVQITDWQDRPDGAKCLNCRTTYTQEKFDQLRDGRLTEARTRAAALPTATRLVYDHELSGRTPAGPHAHEQDPGPRYRVWAGPENQAEPERIDP